MYVPRPVSAVMESNASLKGWGINFYSVGHTGFHFSAQDAHIPINTKEMLAVKYGLETYISHLTGKHLLLKCDSVTVLSDLRHM